MKDAVHPRAHPEGFLCPLRLILDMRGVTAGTPGNTHHPTLHADRRLDPGMFEDGRANVMCLRQVG